MHNDLVQIVWALLPSFRPPSPCGGSTWGKCPSPHLSCPWWPCTGWLRLWELDARQTSPDPPLTLESLTEMRKSNNDFTRQTQYDTLQKMVSQITTHSFIRFAAWRWAPPVVGVKRRQTRRSFLRRLCLFLPLLLFLLFLLFLDFVVSPLVTYLAPGCGVQTCSDVLYHDFTVLLIVRTMGPDSHVSRCFFLLDDWGTGLFDSSSTSLSLSSHFFFFGFASSTTDSASWVEASCKCVSAKDIRSLIYSLQWVEISFSPLRTLTLLMSSW